MVSREEGLSKCGPFAAMFHSWPESSYLSLINLESPLGAQEIARFLAKKSGLEEYVLFMLRERDWRPQLVGAVAAALGLCDESIVLQLWQTFDSSGSWISPQLAAVLSQVDSRFVDSAIDRLKSRCQMIGATTSSTPLEQHVAQGSARSALRSCKAVASLLALLRDDLKIGGRVAEVVDDAMVIEMASSDADDGGEIAIRWRGRIRTIKETVI